MTIRPKCIVIFHLFFLLWAAIVRPFRQKLESSLNYFFYLHATIRLKYMILFHIFFSICTTIQPKISLLINLFILFVHDHSNKVSCRSYSLIYSFYICANTSYAIFMAVLPLYFVCYIHGYMKS